MTTITLEYKRLTQKRGDIYPYTGKFILPSGEEFSFIGLEFKKMVGQLSDFLNADESIDDVVFQRVDREGIMPMGLGPNMIQMLRQDPLSAYRAMDFNTSSFTTEDDPFSELADIFCTIVYVQLSGGQAMCPLTGTWRPLAYGEKHGWKIRGEGNNHKKWVPVEHLVDSAPAGVTGVERLVFCQWALVDLKKLLALKADRYFLPRDWNYNPDGWIDHDYLEGLLTGYLDDNDGEEIWQEQ
jgi:hypothetical protein